MAEFAQDNSRWQFNTRFILFVMSAIACVFGFFSWQLHQVRQREIMLEVPGIVRGIAFVEGTSGVRHFPCKLPDAPILWRMLGAKEVGGLLLDENQFDTADCEDYQNMFPEADIWIGPIDHVVERDGQVRPIELARPGEKSE